MILMLVIACGCGHSHEETKPVELGYQYPSGFAFVEVPQPLESKNPGCVEPALPLPEAGIPFRDPCYSTRLTRVTEFDGIRGRHEYSRFDPFNCDRTFILLLRETGDYAVYKTSAPPYNQAVNFVFQTDSSEDPRWDNDNPDLLWGLSGFRIIRDDVLSGERTVVKDFAADPHIAPHPRQRAGYLPDHHVPGGRSFSRPPLLGVLSCRDLGTITGRVIYSAGSSRATTCSASIPSRRRNRISTGRGCLGTAHGSWSAACPKTAAG